jgi:hypothetical protein
VEAFLSSYLKIALSLRQGHFGGRSVDVIIERRKTKGFQNEGLKICVFVRWRQRSFPPFLKKLIWRKRRGSDSPGFA